MNSETTPSAQTEPAPALTDIHGPVAGATVAAPAAAEKSPYTRFIALLGIYSDASHRIGALQIRMDQRVLDAAEKAKETFALFQETMADAAAKIEALCRENPAWFAKAKTIKTPFGQVAMKKVTDLVVLDQQNTMALLNREAVRSRARQDEQRRKGEKVEEEFDPTLYLRTKVELNVEALEGLDDATLARLGVSREQRESFSLKATTFDLGKLTQDTAQKGGAE